MSRFGAGRENYLFGSLMTIGALLLGAGLAACGSSSSVSSSPSSAGVSTTSTTARSTTLAGLDLSKLGSLTNYSAKLVNNNILTLSYRVHSPSDWGSFAGGPEPLSINIGASSYERMPSISGGAVSYSWKKVGPADPYQSTPYPSEVKGFIGLTHVSGATLVKKGSCVVDGISGHQFQFVAKGGSIFTLKAQACVADSSGVLLSFDEGSSGTEGPVGYTSAFAITGVNNVGVITVP